MFSDAFVGLACTDCGGALAAAEADTANLAAAGPCPDCGAPRTAEYDLDAVDTEAVREGQTVWDRDAVLPFTADTALSAAEGGTPSVDAPLHAPVAGGDAVAFEVAVSSPLGHVAIARAGIPFALDVDGVAVRVEPGDAPVVTDDRDDYATELGAGGLEEADADALAALDADRGALARLVSGSLRPGRLDREYDVRTVRPGTPGAAVGHLARDETGGWRLDPVEDASVPFLDPATVHRNPDVAD
jgi:hypothetical protein